MTYGDSSPSTVDQPLVTFSVGITPVLESNGVRRLLCVIPSDWKISLFRMDSKVLLVMFSTT